MKESGRMVDDACYGFHGGEQMLSFVDNLSNSVGRISRKWLWERDVSKAEESQELTKFPRVAHCGIKA